MDITYRINGVTKHINNSNEDIVLDSSVINNRHIVKLHALNDIELIEASITFDFINNKQNRYFLNGYQSWSVCRYVDESFLNKNLLSPIYKPVLKIMPVDKFGDYHFVKYDKHYLRSWDIFYSQGENEVFVFNHNYQFAYLVIYLDKKKNKIILSSDINGCQVKQDKEITLFDYEQYDSYQEGMSAFNNAFPFRNIEKIFGYTSWYNYYQNINEEIINRDLEALDNRFNLFQIDDGFETFVGDWYDIDKKKFPNGLKPIVDKIHKKGMKAGIWLNPFGVELKSKMYQEHQDWLIKDEKGQPLKVGIGWSGHYALDLRIPQVRRHIAEFLKFYMEMGFDFFKLDFLYTSNLVDMPMPRAMRANKAYEFLRNVLKDKLILGCGATIFNAYPYFDYMRIGPDVSLNWKGVWYVPQNLANELYSSKFAISNTIYRNIFNQRLFANDPDVFILRDSNIKLNQKQKESLSTINALCGSVLMNSDTISNYSPWAKKQLDYILDLFMNAKNVTWSQKDNKKVHFEYEINEKICSFDYNIQKGIIYNKSERNI